MERQQILLATYGFLCDCVACTNNFPLYNRLKSIDKTIFKAAAKGKRALTKMNVNEVKKYFREYCKLIQNHYGKAFPSTEIVLLQECILQCISIVTTPNDVIA